MNPVWPTRFEEQLLVAAFAPEQVSRNALAACSAGDDETGKALLPLVYRRWPTEPGRLIESGRLAYLATWRRSREQMDRLAAVGAFFEAHGIRWMALKGAAVILGGQAELGTRAMSDLDILIEPKDVPNAAALLEQNGYRAEEGAAVEAIVSQTRVRHAWQFLAEPDANIDLHWRPLSRCYAPAVSQAFWEGAGRVSYQEHDMLVPSVSDQLFHACVHGLQWDWTRKVRWIADALSLMRGAIDWERVARLAESAILSCRLGKALAFLRERFEAAVPADLPGSLLRSAAHWEEREYEVLLKPCPLGFRDSLAWHAYHFRRIRPFDEGWRRMPVALAFPRYVAAFLDAADFGSWRRKLRPHFEARMKRASERVS